MLFVAASLGVLIPVLGVAYAVDTSTRNRLVPIQWEGVENSRAAGVTVRLERDGFAYVENVPEGQESEQTYNDRQYICFEQAPAKDTFTGAASWEWLGEWGIRLRFDTSSVVLKAEKSGYFLPDPDWAHPWFDACGEPLMYWVFATT